MNRDGIFERSAIVLAATTAASAAVFGYGHASPAEAATIYRDAPSNSFAKHSYGRTDGWTYVKNGGYNNSSQVWSNYDGYGPNFDDGVWQFSGVRAIGEAQAYITSQGRGIATYCAYGCAHINQGMYHGWKQIFGSQSFPQQIQISDHGVSMDYGRVAADAVRVFT